MSSTASPADDYSKQYPELLQPYPLSTGQVLQVTCQGAGTLLLGYQEYVDPAQPKDQLQTLVYLPGTPGCRFFTHPTIRRLGHLPGFRLIVLERPGIGLSDPWPPHSDSIAPGGVDVAAFAPVFQAFCERLGINNILLVGYSSGTPYALAAACRCQKGLIRAIAVIGAIAPPYPGIGKGMATFFRLGYWACTAWPWFVGWVVRGEGRASRRAPLASLRQLFAAYTSTKGDKEAWPQAEPLFLESHLEMGSRFQEETVLLENLRVARPWGFDLADICIPVGVWQGDQDVGCTVGMAEFIRGKVAGCYCTIMPGKGHLAWLDDAVLQEVLNWLTSST